MRIVVAASLIGLLASSTTACDSGNDREIRARRAELFAGPHIALAEAIAIAQAQVPGAEPVQAELEVELEENEIAYEVQLLSGMQPVEVEIDPVTGEVLEVEYGPDDDEGSEDDA